MITCLITGKPFPREFRTFAISKVFINHVRIASLGGEISHVSVISWYRGPICVVAIARHVIQRISDPRLLIQMTSYEVASNSIGLPLGVYMGGLL